jgi:hypothetical protein
MFHYKFKVMDIDLTYLNMMPDPPAEGSEGEEEGPKENEGN